MDGGYLIAFAIAVMAFAMVVTARTLGWAGAASHAASATAGDPWIEFLRELQRSRRTERPLTLLRLDGAVAPIASLQAAQWLAAHIREVDRVWVDDESIFLLLPEAEAGSTTTIVDRLVTACPKALIGRRLGWANFPVDALTSEELVRRTEARLEPVRMAVPPGGSVPTTTPTGATVSLRSVPRTAAADQGAARHGPR